MTKISLSLAIGSFRLFPWASLSSRKTVAGDRKYNVARSRFAHLVAGSETMNDRDPGASYSGDKGRPGPSGDREGDLFGAFDLFRSYFDTKLSTLKQELTSTSCKQKEKDNIPYFKNTSCKIQFQFNTDISNLLHFIVDSDSLDSNKEKAKEALRKIKYRNKLIRLADNSPGGWATVKEYETPKLGSDSDDECKIKRAEAKAVRKLKKGNPTNADSLSFFPDRMERRPAPAATFGYPGRSSGAGPIFPSRPMATGMRDLFRTYSPYQDHYQSQQPYSRTPDKVICFACGKRGHFRRECEWLSKFNQSANRDVKPTGANSATK
ncbi:uncharacterized protein LOC128226154 [Mya arenaria]|uniref:uncharacterized protein LOC128226154 n=1 Tax=Mya arenaria TaxID=6604 RepID=UPI0022E7001F|nr:uncharacterized protein LOC128226154 [Mya arenaria]